MAAETPAGSTAGGPAGGNIRKLVVLPYGKSLEISIKSIRVRFFRNLVTVMTLVLAVAFLSFVLSTGEMAQGMLGSGNPELRTALDDAGFDVPATGDSMTSSPKVRWIIILSLLVCTVGIVNAQLMAVTERFREIGTMKCLGALDRFVLRLFLMEAAIQGVVGAGAGAILGMIFALLTGLVRFGTPALAHLSLSGLFISVAASMGVGLLLSLIGVFYPALVAARMQPVEAMRSE